MCKIMFFSYSFFFFLSSRYKKGPMEDGHIPYANLDFKLCTGDHPSALCHGMQDPFSHCI